MVAKQNLKSNQILTDELNRFSSLKISYAVFKCQFSFCISLVNEPLQIYNMIELVFRFNFHVFGVN